VLRNNLPGVMETYRAGFIELLLKFNYNQKHSVPETVEK